MQNFFDIKFILSREVLQHSLWTFAMVISLLILIRIVLGLYDSEVTNRGTTRLEKIRKYSLDSGTILLFLGLFSWSSFLLLYVNLSILPSLSVGFLVALGMSYLLKSLFLEFPFAVEHRQLLDQTGAVFQHIPPHCNGTGTVHLNIRETQLEIEAMSVGKALQAGEPIKIIDIVNDRVVLVAPIDRSES